MQCHDKALSLSHRICPSVEAHISLNQTIYIGKQTVGEQPVKTQILVPCVSSSTIACLSHQNAVVLLEKQGEGM